MAAVNGGVVALAELRELAATALAPSDDGDPAVHADVVDALEPPALMLSWDEPWLILGAGAGPTMGRCIWSARLAVLCVAGRAEPGPGIGALEALVGYVVARLADDTYTWPFAAATAPRAFEIGGVRYLGARLTYQIPVTV